jgi:hypothetical protein
LIDLFSGSQESVEPREQPVDVNAQGRCQWQLLHPRHGTEVKVTVNCINGVLLQKSMTSLPVTVVLRPPDISQVLIFLEMC